MTDISTPFAAGVLKDRGVFNTGGATGIGRGRAEILGQEPPAIRKGLRQMEGYETRRVVA